MYEHKQMLLIQCVSTFTNSVFLRCTHLQGHSMTWTFATLGDVMGIYSPVGPRHRWNITKQQQWIALHLPSRYFCIYLHFEILDKK